MRVFLYDERESFLHHLNPLTKLAFATAVMLLLTLIVDPLLSLILVVLTVLLTTTLGRIGPWRVLRILAPVVILSFGVIWTTALFYVVDPASHPRILWSFGPLTFTDEGLAYGLVIMLRMVGFFAASLLFVLTTDPTDFVQALIQKAHLGDRFGYGAHAAYGFVPLLDNELATIRAAHRVRGVKESGGIGDRYRYFVGLLVPLLAGAVRRAERVALAMDARGFGAYPDRTYYRHSTFGVGDLVFVLGVAAALGGILVGLQDLGWLGHLVPPLLR